MLFCFVLVCVENVVHRMFTVFLNGLNGKNSSRSIVRNISLVYLFILVQLQRVFFCHTDCYLGNQDCNASVNSSCAQPQPLPRPPGYCGAFARLLSLGGGAFANFALPGGRVFANPELLTRTRFPVRIQLHKGFYWKNKGIGSFVKDRKQLKRFVKACSRFYACMSSLLIKPELRGNGAIDVNQRLLNQISVEYFKTIRSYF